MMKTLIMTALEAAEKKLFDQAQHQTKNRHHCIVIEEINPFSLPAFLERNHVPRDAHFSCTCDFDNHDDGEVVVRWITVEPLTLLEKEECCRDASRFRAIAWSCVYKALTEQGWKRVGFCSSELDAFDDTTVLKMYRNHEWDRLEAYYSLFFKFNTSIRNS